MKNVNLTAQLSGINEITISGYYGRSVVINESVLSMIERCKNESKDAIDYLTEALELFISSRDDDAEFSDLFLKACRLLIATKSFIEDIKCGSTEAEKEEEESSMEGGAL